MISLPLVQVVQMGLEYSLVLWVDAGLGQWTKQGVHILAWPMQVVPEAPMVARPEQVAMHWVDTGDMAMAGMHMTGHDFRHRFHLSEGQEHPDAQGLIWCPCLHVSPFCPYPHLRHKPWLI